VMKGDQIIGTDSGTRGDASQAIARAIAFYLPQFHPIPENDKAWGQGFTEWTNVAKAKPLFKGHDQPRLPADLGFYDLRVPDVREAQAQMAKTAGIEGFCYWHYWFGSGRQVLERPFNEVLASGKPDFPFCLAWANESWTGRWHGLDKKVIAQQEYPGPDDEKQHFNVLHKAFQDDRYIRVNGKPLFILYRPREHPRQREFVDLWRRMAQQAGLPGLVLLGVDTPSWDWKSVGFDGRIERTPANFISPSTRIIGPDWQAALWQSLHHYLRLMLGHRFKLSALNAKAIETHHYAKAVDRYPEDTMPTGTYPTVISNWDNTPRSGRRGMIFGGETPDHYRRWLKKAAVRLQDNPQEQRLLFIKSWNEWAEGNYLEPDARHGHAYLKATRHAMHPSAIP